MSVEAGDILIENWRGVFRHSAGRLGSHYLKSLRERGQFVGWRTALGGKPLHVLVPPKDLGGDGEWVDVGPGATLLSAVSVSTSNVLPLELARVRLDGADSVIFARVNLAKAERDLKNGDRLIAHFGQVDAQGRRDFWFEADEAGR